MTTPRDLAMAMKERAMESKAARIRELYAAGMKLRAIAAEVGCRVEYARTCARQRQNGMSDIDKRYRAKPHVAERMRERNRTTTRLRRARQLETQKAMGSA